MREIKAVLFGHPNVGKSSIFTSMTGLFVEVSNYPGTTVEIYKGCTVRGDTRYIIIDVPGAFSTVPSTTAEDIARKVILEEKPDIIIHIADATSIRHHLYLTIELLDLGIPLILVLNQIDRARELGIEIDKKKLENELNIPVIFTSAITGEGIEELMEKISEVIKAKKTTAANIRLSRRVESIIEEVQHSIEDHLNNYKRFSRAIASWIILGDREYQYLNRYLPEKIKNKFVEAAKIIMLDRIRYIDKVYKMCVKSQQMRMKIRKTEYIMMKPLYGTLFAISITFLIIWGLLAIIHEMGHRIPFVLYHNYYDPCIRAFINSVIEDKLIRNILIGESPGIYSSLGILTTGIFFVFFMILPSMFVIYIIIGILEDLGFIPRVVVSCHNGMRHFGMSGDAVIPIIAGTGCSIVGILSSRTLRSEKDRVLSSFIQVFGVPCIAQQIMIWALLGRYGIFYVLMLYLILITSVSFIGLLASRLIPGDITFLLMELPAWRKPKMSNIFKKAIARVKSFLTHGVPLVFLGVLTVNIMYYTGIALIIAKFFEPIISGIFGLPSEIALALIIGILRKDVAVGILGGYSLTASQTLIAVSLITLYFPCIGSLLIFLSEFRVKRTVLIIILMLGFSTIIGLLLRIILIH